jgi:hypothetical protein
MSISIYNLHSSATVEVVGYPVVVRTAAGAPPPTLARSVCAAARLLRYCPTMKHEHIHQHACDCAAHRAKPAEGAGLWSTLLPVLACAVCPACMATYAKLFSVLGVGVGLSEVHHLILLTLALSASLGLSAYRTFRSRRAWPLATALVGASLVVFGHVGGELAWAEWSGIFVLLAGGLTEHFRLRAAAAAQLAPA